MPPKDSIELDKDTIYIGTSEGLRHLGDIAEATEEEDAQWGVPWPKENPYIVKRDASATATFFADLTKEQYEAFYRLCIKPTLDWWERWKPLVFKLWTMGVTACHYMQAHPRVAHLALHGKTQRIRKKNQRRIIKELRKD